MSQRLTKEQYIQDNQYVFPYHYVASFRNGFSQTFNHAWGINYVSTIEFLLAQLKEQNFNTLIDIGCGDGRLVKELVQDFPDKDVIGVDYSRRAIDLAKALSPGRNYQCADITTETVAKADICTLIEVFEHIPPDIAEKFIEGVANQLKAAGLLLLTVPHNNVQLAAKHYRHFDSNLLRNEFSKRFEIIRIIPFEKMARRRRVINRLLTNKFFILNNGALKQVIYNYYKEKLFLCEDESKCQRLFMIAKKK